MSGTDYNVLTLQTGGQDWCAAYTEKSEPHMFIGLENHDFGVMTVQLNPSNNPAWWIKADLSRGLEAQPTQSGDFMVEWDPSIEHYADPPYNTVTKSWYTWFDHIYISASMTSSDIIWHEMGHNIMGNFYSSCPPNSNCNHGPGGTSIHDNYDSCYQGRAWVEGGANFWKALVKHVNDPQYVPEYETIIGADPGDAVIHNITAALWDIYDSNNDGYDQISDGLVNIWDTIDTIGETDDTFSEFWLRLKPKYGISVESQAPAAWALYQNTIIYPEFRWQVTTTVNGGSGSVTLSPAGGYYTGGTPVTVTAIPAPGYAFSSWSGGLTGSNNPAVLTVNSDVAVTASLSALALPTLTFSVTNITADSVTFNGNLINMGGNPQVSVVFEYRPVNGAWVLLLPWQDCFNTGNFSANVTGLQAGTKYEYHVCYYTAAFGYCGTSNQTFDTPAGGGFSLPTITASVSNVTDTSATFNGNLSNMGGNPLISVAFEYKPANGAWVLLTPWQDMVSPGAFNRNVGGLQPGIVYYYHVCYYTQAFGYCGTPDQSFTTQSAPPNPVITATAGANGSISPSGTVSVTPGGSASFSISANTGYVISDVIVDGGSVGAVSSYTFYNVLTNRTINAVSSQGVI